MKLSKKSTSKESIAKPVAVDSKLKTSRKKQREHGKLTITFDCNTQSVSKIRFFNPLGADDWQLETIMKAFIIPIVDCMYRLGVSEQYFNFEHEVAGGPPPGFPHHLLVTFKYINGSPLEVSK